jgi:hypothetical protein
MQTRRLERFNEIAFKIRTRRTYLCVLVVQESGLVMGYGYHGRGPCPVPGRRDVHRRAGHRGRVLSSYHLFYRPAAGRQRHACLYANQPA